MSLNLFQEIRVNVGFESFPRNNGCTYTPYRIRMQIPQFAIPREFFRYVKV